MTSLNTKTTTKKKLDTNKRKSRRYPLKDAYGFFLFVFTLKQIYNASTYLIR